MKKVYIIITIMTCQIHTEESRFQKNRAECEKWFPNCSEKKPGKQKKKREKKARKNRKKTKNPGFSLFSPYNS